ncbi:MAG: hypothetical protein ACLROI_02900 [Beduini sp.]|uniref:hypothetical protein n=1 Tax=Beduini sp. TaxID=1922300 RepID=UPI0011C7137F
MFKKLTILLCCFFISGCSAQSKKSSDEPPVQETKGSLVHQKLYHGSGNDKGFYHIVFNETGDGDGSNILYYDYAAKKEIYLCDKPQCQHHDEACTSYLGAMGFSSTLFVHGDYLYLLNSETGMSMGDSQSSSASAIYRMSLDGKNREKLCTLPAGYSYSDNRLTFDDRYLYIPLHKTEDIQLEENSYMQHVTDSAIFTIDLQSGKTSHLLDNKDRNIIAAENRQIIFSQYHYSQDPEKLLNEKRFDEYEAVMKNVNLSYYAYDLDKQEIIWESTAPVSEISTYYQNKLYYIEGYNLHAVSVDTQQDKIIAKLPDNLLYSLNDVFDGHLIISGWNKGEEGYVTSYAWNLNDQQMKEITLKTSAPVQDITIYSEYEQYFFVYYDHDQHLEKTWAGTDQYTMDTIYVGLISKEDYWNNVAHYQPFETLSQGIAIRR